MSSESSFGTRSVEEVNLIGGTNKDGTVETVLLKGTKKVGVVCNMCGTE